MFQKAVPTQHVTNPVNIPSFYCTQDIPLTLDSMQYRVFSCLTDKRRPHASRKRGVRSEAGRTLGRRLSVNQGGGGGRYSTLLHFSPVQLIFSILIQHHISKLSKYFLTTLQNVQNSAPHKAVLQM